MPSPKWPFTRPPEDFTVREDGGKLLDWTRDPFSEKMGPEEDPENQGLRKGYEKQWAHLLKDLE